MLPADGTITRVWWRFPPDKAGERLVAIGGEGLWGEAVQGRSLPAGDGAAALPVGGGQRPAGAAAQHLRHAQLQPDRRHHGEFSKRRRQSQQSLFYLALLTLGGISHKVLENVRRKINRGDQYCILELKPTTNTKTLITLLIQVTWYSSNRHINSKYFRNLKVLTHCWQDMGLSTKWCWLSCCCEADWWSLDVLCLLWPRAMFYFLALTIIFL